MFGFLERDSIYAIARCMPSPVRPSVRPSVCLSVTRVDQSKTFEVRITKPSPQSSPMTLVSWCGTAPWNSNGKIGSGDAKYERGMKKRIFSHCRYCIPIHQAALLSRADRCVSWAFLLASVILGKRRTEGESHAFELFQLESSAPAFNNAIFVAGLC